MCCNVKNGNIPGRFSRPAYYQLAHFIQEDQLGCYVTAGGTKYHVRPAPQ